MVKTKLFLGTNKLPKLAPKVVKHWAITIRVEMVIEKSTYNNKTSSPDSYTGEFYQDFKVQNSHLIKGGTGGGEEKRKPLQLSL